MGQDFSVEDVTFPYITRGQTYETMCEFLDDINKRVESDRSVTSSEIVFYTRHRTGWGSPAIKKSTTEDELKMYEVDIEAFPSPATQDEIREFDKLLFTGKHRKQKKKQRSRSFNETSFRLPVLSRPKFVDRIITSYSSLTRKPPGKQKKYQKQLSLDQSTFCFNSSDNPTVHCVPENDDFCGNGHAVATVVDDIKFCFKCGLPILFEDVKSCLVDSGGLTVTCQACVRESSHDFVSPENDDNDNGYHTPTESLEWLHEVPALSLINPLFTELNLCKSERPDSPDNFEITDETEPTCQTVESDQDIIKSDLPVVTSHVRRQCEAFLQSSQSYGSCPALDTILPGSRNDCTDVIDKPVLRHLQRKPLCPQTDQTNRWAKNYFSLTRDRNFSQTVMAKGYVKALAEQINQQGTLKQFNNDEDELNDAYSEMSKSTSSVGSCRNEEIQVNLVHTLIQAAEQQTFKENDLVRPPRKLTLSSNHESASQNVNVTDSNCFLLLNTHSVSELLTGKSDDFSTSSTDDKLFANKDSEVLQVSKASVNSSHSSTAASPRSSASSSPKTSPTGSSPSSQFPVKDLRSSNSHKSVVNHGPKPKIPAKPCLEKNAMLNACRASELPSPSMSLPRPASLCQAAHTTTASSPVNSSPTSISTILPKLQTATVPSPRSPMTQSSTTHSPESPNKSPLTSPVALSPVTSSPKPILKPSPKPISPMPSFISLSSNSPLSPKSPKTPSPLSAINLTFAALSSLSPTNPTPKSPLISPPKTNTPSKTPPPPKTPPPRTPALSPKKSSSPAQFKFESQSSTTSNSQTDTVQQWLSETQSSLSSDTGSSDVCLRPVSKRSSDQYRDSVFKTIYDNPTPLSAAELFDSSWSDSDGFNEISDEDDEEDNNREKTHSSKTDVVEQIKAEATDRAEDHLEDRRFHIAEELLQTERDYVARLHLLHHTFYFRLDKENRQQVFLPADTLKHMFSNTKSIFLFHNDFVLPQLENRMKNWENCPRIGDLMKKNAPFLKMYTEYIRNFDRAMKLINQWMEKSAKFSEIIQDIQKLPECRNLSLQHHMLGPIQRVPRYELLLKDYVRHLPENSPDMNDARDALDLVTKAACHSNEAMNKIETFHKLLDIYQSLRGVPVDFISPTREFVTQGPVTKIAARSGEKQPRQIFLFNDLVLICTQYNLLGTYSVRSQLEVDGMEIKPGTSMHIPNTFLVHSKQKAVELLDENPTGEPVKWQEKIQTVITNYKKRKRSIKQEDLRESEQETGVPESCIGKTAPVWIQDVAATMCMLCRQTFNMVRRRHHCRACGWLICKACSKKAPLAYNQGKIDRVCVTCYNVIVNKHSVAHDSPDGKTSSKKKSILNVSASSGLISGYMNCSDDGGHTWAKLWVTAHKDFVLYTFRAHEDVSAISSLPLPGHEVNEVLDMPGRQHVFCIGHKKKKIMMFQTDNDKRLQRWTSVLTKLANAQLPDENSRLSSQSNSSNSSSVSDSGTMHNDMSSCNNKRSSTHSGSQADSGYPGDSNNSLATLGVDGNDHENTDGVSQYDNMDGVVNDKDE